MKSVPNFSVVIPLYNHKKFIGSALESVLNQSLSVSEIILIDDGSIDDGFEYARKSLSKDKRAKLIKQSNAGTAETLNRAISIAESEWIAVLNSDDIFQVTKLENCAKIIIKHPDVAVIFGLLDFIDSNGILINNGIPIEWLNRSLEFYKRVRNMPLSIINENFIATTSNLVFKKSLWSELRGFRNFRYCNDLDFILRAIHAKPFYFDDGNKHIMYRIHDSNTISENIVEVRLERAFVIMKNLPNLDFSKTSSESVKEVLDNLRLSEVIFNLSQFTNSNNDVMQDWEKAKTLLRNQKFFKLLNF